MKKEFCFFILFLVLSISCASPRIVVNKETSQKPVATPTATATEIPIPQAPVLSDSQLLGFIQPPDMLQDNASDHYALPAVMRAFWRFREYARTEGWNLILVSGYRSYKTQRRIWNQSDDTYLEHGATDQKKRVEAVMSLVSVPGLSRHHWGTELDISESTLRGQLVNVEPDTPEKVMRFYDWMEKNAPKFGFCKVYLGKDGAVHNEPWHWSFLPYSKTYQKQFMAIKDFKKIFDINVEDVDYLIRNFNRILKGEKNSINPICGD